jgi:signal transduction histidine kinase
MPAPNNVDYQLKEASQMTNVAWSALAEREMGKWRLLTHYRLGKKTQPALVKFLSRGEVDSWLCGALSGGQSRSVSIPDSITLDVERLFAFPLQGGARVALVGANHLGNDAQRLWRLAVSGMRGEDAAVNESALASSVAGSLLIPDLDSENPFDLPRALDRALAAFIRLTPAQGAFLAIRRGDALDVRAQWNAASCADLSLLIEAHTLFRRMNRNLTPMVVSRGDALWAQIPHKGLKSNTRLWTSIPLVIGQRLIGALVLWRASAFKGEEWNRLIDLSTQIAPPLETLITIAEMASHLRRLAMLNDFALTVSSGRSLDQIARRVFALLSRTFGTELILLYLLSSDNRLLHEYRVVDGNMTSTLRSVEEHRIAPLLKTGQKLRLGEKPEYALPLYEGATSGLYLPLRFREQTIGLLSVESIRSYSYNFFDESLLQVIASHLASLADYTRLREEAEGRARNLELIHEVVQQVIGLTEKRAVAEITADLLARYFAYELAAVFIADEKGNLTVGGFGGASQNVVKRAMKSVEYPVIGGITGQVFETGEGILVNDVLQDKRYHPIKGWQAGSEMCVAIREGTKILGIIDVESSSRNAFMHNDFIALESLAGILASVITSADQYQRLQVTINQLRAMQVELHDRMEAQRSAENRLIQAAKLAAVGEMAAGIAHELNNPLTSVTGFSELVMENLPPGADTYKDIELVLKEARRARDVVRRLLDFARQSESIRSNASMNEVIEDVITLSRHLIKTSGVELKLNLQDDLPWTSMDSNQMKQVMLNLVHNALQAMPEGGTLEIESLKSSRNNRAGVMVVVRDTGVGIPQAEQARIFEPFYTTKGHKGGTGLGLSVTYGIVTDHGGQIDVESRPGVGSKFMVWLPI